MTPQHSMQKRYENAHLMIKGFLNKNVFRNTSILPRWIEGSDNFWYLRHAKEGKEFRLVDASQATNQPAFDHRQLASALAEASQKEIDENNFPFNVIEIVLPTKLVRFNAFGKRWQFNALEGHCVEIKKVLSEQEILSPNGQFLVYGKDNNIWLREVETGEEKALTIDGEADFVYGGPGTAWGEAFHGLQVLWSSDSQRIFTVQRDTRNVEAIPIVHHVPANGSIRPQLEFQKFAYPGEEHVETLRLLAIDVHSGRHQPAHYVQIPTVRNNFGLFSNNLAWWNKDNRRAYFVHVDRYYKYVRVMEFDTDTGLTRLLFEEKTDTHFNLALNTDEKATLIPLPDSNEILWFSERTDWAHLYLYDLETGELKQPVTSGEWLVRQSLHFDPKRREVFLQTAGRVQGRDPYYRDLVRVNIDTGELTALISSDHEYTAHNERDLDTSIATGTYESGVSAVSDTGNYAVVTRSRADQAPINLLVNRNGEEILEVEKADLSELVDGWQWPEPVKLKADDGITDIYGLIYRPSDFSPERSYPVVSHLFSTPELAWVAKGSFANSAFAGHPYMDAAALAELGCIVVQIDGRGTPFRNKAFHDASYRKLGSVSDLADHVAGLRQIAERYPYMDLDRIGITTQCSGGPGAVEGLLEYPDFFKVGIAGPLHDSRMVSATMWGDMFEGAEGPDPEQKRCEELVENLSGKLLLTVGMLDQSTPPASIFRVVEALQKANKDFDMLLLPSLGHDLSSYLSRRMWDYFVIHLMGEEPPKEYRLSGVFGQS